MAEPTAQHTSRRTPAWGAPAAVGGFGATLVGALALIDPATRASVSPGCPFRTLTGLDCPGCGATRAVYALTQGDVALAADHNLLAVMIVPVLVIVWAAWLLRRVRDGRTAAPPLPPLAVTWGIVIVVVAFSVARNLPWAPFSWLGSLPGG